MHKKLNFKLLLKYLFHPIFCLAGPSENYWEVLAERRQIVLDDALEKIRTLEERIDKLTEQNERLKEEKLVHEEMLKETRALIEVLQVMLILCCINILYSTLIFAL